ncbi:hypothetical protein D3C72_1010840 [compost metagenome]
MRVGRDGVECRCQQLGHLSHAPLTPGGQTKRVEGDVDVFLPCDCVADGLCKLGLARADVTLEHDKGRPAADNFD